MATAGLNGVSAAPITAQGALTTQLFGPTGNNHLEGLQLFRPLWLKELTFLKTAMYSTAGGVLGFRKEVASQEDLVGFQRLVHAPEKQLHGISTNCYGT